MPYFDLFVIELNHEFFLTFNTTKQYKRKEKRKKENRNMRSLKKREEEENISNETLSK